MQLSNSLLLVAVLVAAVPKNSFDLLGPAQQVIQSISTQQLPNKSHRKLKGKFLHITDFHPDPFYKVHTDPRGDHPCHQGKDSNHTAGYYGAPKTSCDSPYTLVNATFKWIKENIKDDIDFVIWTGDSARHDNDEDIPRHNYQVLEQNQYLVDKFVEVFGKHDRKDDPDPTNDFLIPIVPTIGNNDMLPHNIFMPGPNSWTKNYEVMWRQFIPEEQKHSFARGGWFWTEVIPKKLAVISLNTMYFFASNSAVDGCDLKSEPGYEHMEWLRIQLQFLRERGLKAILIGHVPPARTEGKANWDETCYQKYVLWLRQYRDVIVASFYGHMNIDHFMFHDVKELKYDFDIDGIDNVDDAEISRLRQDSPDRTTDHEVRVTGLSKSDYLNELREGWAKLPTLPRGTSFDLDDGIGVEKRPKKGNDFYKNIGGRFGERYSMSMVSPSVVPNYFPTLRIIEYNISGLEQEYLTNELPQGYSAQQEDLRLPRPPEEPESAEEERGGDFATDKKKRKKHKKPSKGKPGFPVPAPPSKSTPPGPAYSPQTFSLISWTQFYANLSSINEKVHSKVNLTLNVGMGGSDSTKQDPFSYEVEYETNNGTTYTMHDLTIRHWLAFAQRMGQALDKSKETTDRAINDHLENTADFEAHDDEINIGKKKKQKKKHGNHKDKKGEDLKSNKLWHMFVRRAYVLSLSDEELESEFD